MKSQTFFALKMMACHFMFVSGMRYLFDLNLRQCAGLFISVAFLGIIINMYRRDL